METTHEPGHPDQPRRTSTRPQALEEHDLVHELIHHAELPHSAFSLKVDGWIRRIGSAISWIWLLLVGVIVLNVSMRYLLGEGRIEFEEIQWHLYAIGFLLGLSYCLESDDHVRVDVLYERFTPKTKAWVELFGILLFLFPFIALVLWYAVPFVAYSASIGEVSESPGGLPVPLGDQGGPAARLRAAGAGHPVAPQPGDGAAVFKWPRPRRGPGARAMEFNEILCIAMFVSFIGLLFTGFPVAWVLGGLAVVFTAIGWWASEYSDLMADSFYTIDWAYSSAVVDRIWDVMKNWVLVALPMFVFMGLMLDRSGIAAQLMTNFVKLFGRVRGGLAVTVALIGILLAASTGIIGASVVLLSSARPAGHACRTATARASPPARSARSARSAS